MKLHRASLLSNRGGDSTTGPSCTMLPQELPAHFPRQVSEAEVGRMLPAKLKEGDKSENTVPRTLACTEKFQRQDYGYEQPEQYKPKLPLIHQSACAPRSSLRLLRSIG